MCLVCLCGLNGLSIGKCVTYGVGVSELSVGDGVLQPRHGVCPCVPTGLMGQGQVTHEGGGGLVGG
jgi:hypothetical protein